jgi:centriolar protein POC1
MINLDFLRHNHDRYGHQAAIYDICHDDNESYVYTCDGNGWIVRWSSDHHLTDGQLIAKCDTSVFCMVIVGDRLIAGDMHGYINVIDTVNLWIVKRILAHRKGVYNIISTDTQIITCGADGTVKIWDKESLALLIDSQISSTPVRSLMCAGGHIYAGDGLGYLFCLSAKAQPILSVKAHDKTIFSIVNHNNTIYTGGRDALLKSWNIDTLQSIAVISAHWFTINKILSIDQHIYTLSRDKRVRIWNGDNGLQSSIDFVDGGHIRSVNGGISLSSKQQLWTVGDDKMLKVWDLN